MKIDPTASAYGLFQVLFADVADHIAGAIFELQKRQGKSVTLQEISHRGFKGLLREFRQELRNFKANGDLATELKALCAVCRRANALRIWRNARIHARVRRVDDGLALFDENGMRLSISLVECEKMIDEALWIITNIDEHLQPLIDDLKFQAPRKEFSAVIASVVEAHEEDSDSVL